jgi:phosphoglucomutase
MGVIDGADKPFLVTVVDPTHVYTELMKSLFNFDDLRAFL